MFLEQEESRRHQDDDDDEGEISISGSQQQQQQQDISEPPKEHRQQQQQRHEPSPANPMFDDQQRRPSSLMNSESQRSASSPSSLPTSPTKLYSSSTSPHKSKHHSASFRRRNTSAAQRYPLLHHSQHQGPISFPTSADDVRDDEEKFVSDEDGDSGPRSSASPDTRNRISRRHAELLAETDRLHWKICLIQAEARAFISRARIRYLHYRYLAMMGVTSKNSQHPMFAMGPSASSPSRSCQANNHKTSGINNNNNKRNSPCGPFRVDQTLLEILRDGFNRQRVVRFSKFQSQQARIDASVVGGNASAATWQSPSEAWEGRGRREAEREARDEKYLKMFNDRNHLADGALLTSDAFLQQKHNKSIATRPTTAGANVHDQMRPPSWRNANLMKQSKTAHRWFPTKACKESVSMTLRQGSPSQHRQRPSTAAASTNNSNSAAGALIAPPTSSSARPASSARISQHKQLMVTAPPSSSSLSASRALVAVADQGASHSDGQHRLQPQRPQTTPSTALGNRPPSHQQQSSSSASLCLSSSYFNPPRLATEDRSKLKQWKKQRAANQLTTDLETRRRHALDGQEDEDEVLNQVQDHDDDDYDSDDDDHQYGTRDAAFDDYDDGGDAQHGRQRRPKQNRSNKQPPTDAPILSKLQLYNLAKENGMLLKFSSTGVKRSDSSCARAAAPPTAARTTANSRLARPRYSKKELDERREYDQYKNEEFCEKFRSLLAKVTTAFAASQKQDQEDRRAADDAEEQDDEFEKEEEQQEQQEQEQQEQEQQQEANNDDDDDDKDNEGDKEARSTPRRSPTPSPPLEGNDKGDKIDEPSQHLLTVPDVRQGEDIDELCDPVLERETVNNQERDHQHEHEQPNPEQEKEREPEYKQDNPEQEEQNRSSSQPPPPRSPLQPPLLRYSRDEAALKIQSAQRQRAARKMVTEAKLSKSQPSSPSNGVDVQCHEGGEPSERVAQAEDMLSTFHSPEEIDARNRGGVGTEEVGVSVCDEKSEQQAPASTARFSRDEAALKIQSAQRQRVARKRLEQAKISKLFASSSSHDQESTGPTRNERAEPDEVPHEQQQPPVVLSDDDDDNDDDLDQGDVNDLDADFEFDEPHAAPQLRQNIVEIDEDEYKQFVDDEEEEL